MSPTTTHLLKGLTTPLVALSLAVGACSSDGGASVGATCQSTCEKSTALACPNDPPTVEACVSACEAQIADCGDDGIIQRYLDCVQTSSMSCGDTLGTASSPACMQEGLAYFACLQGITDTPDATSGGDADTTSGADTSGAIGPPPTPVVADGELAVTLRRDGQDVEIRCDMGASYLHHTPVGPPFNVAGVSIGCVAEGVMAVFMLVSASEVTAGRHETSTRSPGNTPGGKVTVKIEDSERNGWGVMSDWYDATDAFSLVFDLTSVGETVAGTGSFVGASSGEVRAGGLLDMDRSFPVAASFAFRVSPAN